MHILMPVAWISGRAGKAIIESPDGLFALDAGHAEPRPADVSELANLTLLAGDCERIHSDPYPFHAVFEAMTWRWKRDRSFLMVLCALDPGHDRSLRERAARLASGLLSDIKLLVEVRALLSIQGLPRGADLEGAPQRTFLSGLFASVEVAASGTKRSGPFPADARWPRIQALLESLGSQQSPDAFAELYQLLSPSLRTRCRRKRVSDSEIPDLVQDVWLRYLTELSTEPRPYSVGWFLDSVDHLQWRRAKTAQGDAYLLARAGGTNLLQPKVDEGLLPDEHVARLEKLSSLDGRSFEVVSLLLAGLDRTDIAKALQISNQTVMRILADVMRAISMDDPEELEG